MSQWDQCCLVAKVLQNIFFSVHMKKVIHVWEVMRVRFFKIFLFVCELYL